MEELSFLPYFFLFIIFWLWYPGYWKRWIGTSVCSFKSYIKNGMERDAVTEHANRVFYALRRVFYEM